MGLLPLYLSSVNSFIFGELLRCLFILSSIYLGVLACATIFLHAFPDLPSPFLNLQVPLDFSLHQVSLPPYSLYRYGSYYTFSLQNVIYFKVHQPLHLLALYFYEVTYSSLHFSFVHPQSFFLCSSKDHGFCCLRIFMERLNRSSDCVKRCINKS